MNGPLRLTRQNDVCKYVETYNYVIIDGKIYTYSLVVSFFFFCSFHCVLAGLIITTARFISV